MVEILDAIDSVLYYPILLVVMAAAGLYFSLRMGFVQIHRLPEGMRLVMAKPTDEKGTSPFQALMVSSAACVGTGNIIGISTAICLGGPGAVFWMTVMALIGAASSFVECTLAQIYKRKKFRWDKLWRTGLLHRRCPPQQDPCHGFCCLSASDLFFWF